MTNTNNSSNLKTIAIMTTIILAITTFSWTIYNNKVDKDIFDLQNGQIEQRLDKIDNNLDKILSHIINKKG